MRGTGVFVAACAVLAGPFIVAQTPGSAAADIQFQLGDLLASEGRFEDAVAPYRKAIAGAGDDLALQKEARTGLTFALLRNGDIPAARVEAERLVAAHPQAAQAQALYGETLWASGLFEEADRAYDAALQNDPGEARAHNGRARSLLARGRLDEALVEAQEALRLSPRNAEFHHVVGVIHERARQYELAGAAFANYLNLLPDRDRSDKTSWTRAEIRFLDSFRGRTPVDFGATTAATWTVPVRIDKDKVFVRVKVNRGSPTEFVLDTGAEQTIVSRELARRRRVPAVTAMESAGVGDVGMRTLEVARMDEIQIGDLKVRNVPCLIKNPPLGDLPAREVDSFSPLALGLSMRLDYRTRQLVMARALPETQYLTELPLRLYRLATVRGEVNGQPAPFVVDTGGEAISISQTAAGQVAPTAGYRRIPLRVYGSSGWDKDAFLMPNVDLQFETIRFSRIPVVVLNLKAPSTLLGYQLGGIVGHRFLSRYRVSIDLQKSVVGLDAN